MQMMSVGDDPALHRPNVAPSISVAAAGRPVDMAVDIAVDNFVNSWTNWLERMSLRWARGRRVNGGATGVDERRATCFT